jgi:hypothetical protein
VCANSHLTQYSHSAPGTGGATGCPGLIRAAAHPGYLLRAVPDAVPYRHAAPSGPGRAVITGDGLPGRRALKEAQYQVIHVHRASQSRHPGPLLISDWRLGMGQDADHIFQRQAVLIHIDDVVHPSCPFASQPVLDHDQQAEQLPPQLLIPRRIYHRSPRVGRQDPRQLGCTCRPVTMG